MKQQSIPDRAAYEGAIGGWNDGRIGQAYDLLASVINERKQDTSKHPLLSALEALDDAS